MGTLHTPDRMSGILIPDDRLELWEDETGIFDSGGTKESELGQASPIASLPAKTSTPATDLGLRATGRQSESIEVQFNRGGLPVLDVAGYCVRAADGDPQDWMGCDLPVPLTGFQSVSGAGQRFYPHVVAVGTELSDVAAMVVYADVSGAIHSRNVSDAGAWSGESTIDSAVVAPVPQPCLLRIPSTGRVFCFRWADSGADHQIRGWFTDDDGATWTAIGPVLSAVLSATTYPTRLRLRAVYLDGKIGIFGHVQTAAVAAGVWRDRIIQWASSDGGYTFDVVVEPDGSDEEHAGGYHDVCVWRGEIVLARLVYGTTGVEARVRRLASPWQAWTAGDELSQTGAMTSGNNLGIRTTGGAGDYYLTEGELALWCDDDGALYLTGRHCAGGQDGASPVLRSPNGGEDWYAPGSSLLYAGRGQAWMWTGSNAEEARGITACATQGRSVVIHTVTRTGAATNLLYAAWLGGWQDVPMPSNGQDISPTRRIGWHHVGTAAQLPDECGWALNTGGTPTIILSPGYLHITNGGADTAWYTISPAGTLLEGILDEHAFEVVSGEAQVRLRLQDAVGPRDFDCEVRVTPTSILLWDNNLGNIVGSATTYTGGPVAIKISMEGDDVRVFAHIPGDTILLASSAELCGQAHDYDEIAKTAALTAGGGGGVNQIIWTTTASSEVYWYWWCHASDAYCGDHWYTQPISEKFPRSIIESPSSAIRSVRMSSVSGPAGVGDAFGIDQDALYPYTAPLPPSDPSPRHPWRDDGSALGALVGAVGPTGRLSYKVADVVELSMSKLWGALLDGLSMGGVEVYLYYGAAWNLVGSVGYWEASVSCYGRTLEVASGGILHSAELRRDELAGCLIEVVSGGPPATQSDEQFTVVRNDPGHIDTTAGLSLPLRIELDDAPVTATPFTVRIYPRRALLLIDLALYQARFKAIQIRWPIPRRGLGNPYPTPGPSPLGYHQVATLAAGSVYPFGRRQSWGRRLALEVDTELITMEDGTRSAYERSPVRRRVSCSWSDFVSMHDMDDGAPDTIGYGTGKPPLAMLRRTPVDLQDIVRRLAGSHTVIGWIESIDSEGTGRPDHWADGAFLGRITGPIERDLVLGDEERTAAERVQDCTVEEEI